MAPRSCTQSRSHDARINPKHRKTPVPSLRRYGGFFYGFGRQHPQHRGTPQYEVTLGTTHPLMSGSRWSCWCSQHTRYSVPSYVSVRQPRNPWSVGAWIGHTRPAHLWARWSGFHTVTTTPVNHLPFLTCFPPVRVLTRIGVSDTVCWAQTLHDTPVSPPDRLPVPHMVVHGVVNHAHAPDA